MSDSLQNKFPRRAAVWQLRTQALALPSRPLLMGIVNVTPDSFSDGGKFDSTQAAVDHALRLAEDGADILDIGGESTRPYSTAVSESEELKRVLDVVERVCSGTTVPVSIDTSKASVAEAAIKAGAEIFNDVTGLTGDPQSVSVAVDTGVAVCAMHMQGTPQTMQDNPQYDDIIEEVFEYLVHRRNQLVSAGIDVSKICLDPGVGFGKTHTHNLQLIAAAERFLDTECPILIGHSRKGFLARILGDKAADRTAATVGVSVALATKGIQVIRVHDVKPVREALQCFEAVGALDGEILDLGSAC